MRWNISLRIPVSPFKIKPLRIDQRDGELDSSTGISMVVPRSDDQPQEPVLVPAPSDANSWQFVITHIRVHDTAVDLGRIPVGFYVVVEAEGTEQRTRNKPIPVHDHNMEWDDEVFLPSKLSSNVCLRVCASFEFSPMLGNGETLRTFVLSIGELLEHNEMAISVEFSPLEGQPVSPCSLLHITVERRSCTLDMLTHVSNLQNYTSNSEASSSLVQITDEGHKNLLRYHKDRKPEDLKRSITCFERVFLACPLTHQCRAVALFNLATARLVACQDGITSPDFDVPITLYRDSLDLRPVGHPDRPATLLHLARATVSRFQKWGDEPYAEEARKLIAEVQGICSVESYEYQLAGAILQECTPDEAANGSATVSHPAESPSISELKDAALHAPDCDPRKPAMLNALAFALLGCFERHGRMTDIDESIVAIEKAVQLTQESDPEWPLRAASLGIFIARRFNRSLDMEDLERSISVLDAVVQHIPNTHPDRPVGLSYLGSVLLARFVRLGRVADRAKSTAVLEEALKLVSNDHPNRPALLTHLGVAFLQHYEHLKDPEYLDKSISLMEEAGREGFRDAVGALSTKGRLGHPGNAADLPRAVYTRDETLKLLFNSRITECLRLVGLGDAFQLRFGYFGDHTDLDKSISTREKALKFTPGGQQYRSSCLANLGHTFLLRHSCLGNLTDLQNSTSLLAEAERLTPNDHPYRSRVLVSFGLSLMGRSGQTGNIVDVDKSISLEEVAMQHTPDHDSNKPLLLSGLSFSLLGRFRRLGNLADLEKSTSMIEEAVRLTPKDHSDRGRRLTLLAISLVRYFDRLGHLSDLNKSIVALEEAVQLVSDDDESSDLEKSISMGEKAVLLSRNRYSGSPFTLTVIGRALLKRFSRLGDVADLDKSISSMEKALALIPEGNIGRPAILTNVGISFCCRFLSLGSLPALRTAISYFSRAAHFQPSGQSCGQFQAFKYWFQCAIVLRRVSHLEGQQALLEAFECAISLLPQLAWLGLPFKDRYTKLLEAADTTRSAVSLAVSLGHITRAVEWLEQGRCVVWGQLLQLRTPLDELRQVYPDLADRFKLLSNALEHSSTAYDESLSYLGEENHQEESLEQRARRHRELVTDRENLLEQIEALPGFEQSFSPKTFSQLRVSARLGPIILLNVSMERGDALIVVADLDEPVHVPLPDTNEEQVEELRTSLAKLLSNDGRVISRDSPHRAARLVKQDGHGFSHILSALWMKIVKPVLHALALTTPGKPTRVFWCPAGPLSFLPIHAAGNYDAPGVGNKVSDFVISSYIPTLSILSAPLERNVASNDIRLLAVPQPNSDGQTQLFGAPIEIEYIKETISRHSSAHVHLVESDGNVDGVLNGMERSDWVHFACHGVQDSKSPTESGLCLADQRRLRLSDIIRLSRPRGPGGLAFLSACQTATGAVELSEEAVHLSAGMLFAGYSGVIGTMWSIRDSVAPQLAKDVYEQLLCDCEGRVPDSRGAARALHNAIDRLRRSGAPFIAWVPFIHMGI